MGKISDMILDGQMCQWCGDELQNSQGHPTLCKACQKLDKKNRDKERKRDRVIKRIINH